MSILVTGGLGYVGSHSVKMLVEKGEHVIVLDNLLFGHKGAACGSEFIIGDIGNQELLRDIFSNNKIEAIMHFAALADVGESVAQPEKYYINNVARSLNMLQVMKEFGCDKFIFSSTAATFGEPEQVPIPEDHPKNPTNPYGRSKLMLEEILREYERSYGIRACFLRYFNASGADPSGLIGEDHTPEHHLIPIIMQVALGQREKVFVFGNDWPTPDKTCVRDYVHVTDLAQAHFLALDALRNGAKTTAYNMGNGSGFSVLEVINTVEKVTGIKIPYDMAPRRAGDPAILIASSEKIIKELGWKPKFDKLETIIETAWNWHKNHPNGFGD